MIASGAIALGLALAAATPGTPSAPPTADPQAFVVARGDRLVEGDREYRFLSFNVPNLHYVEDDMRFEQAMPFRWPDEYEIADALESVRQIGGQVVRIYALSVRKAGDPPNLPRHVLGPETFDEAGFAALDTVLAVARQKGVRVIVPLVDNWQWWGGVAEYAAFRGKEREAFWSDPQLIDDFKGTIRFVLTRVNRRTGVAYRDDPTVLAWETGNELHCPQGWTREIASTIKALDPNHLVIDGRHEEVLDRESLDNPFVDLVQTHHYERDPREMIAHIRRSAGVARGRKPYHVGEFGFLTTVGMTAVMDAIVDEGLAGGLIWSLRPHSRDGGFYWHHEPHGGDLFKAYHWPGFASGAPYDEAGLLRELRRRAFAIRGMTEPSREPPAPPEVVSVTAGGLVTWRGSAGAAGYDVLRREATAPAWTTVARDVSDADVQYRPLLCDETAAPGRAYFYRVVARNEAGPSAPSALYGPVSISHRTLADELRDDSNVFLREGALAFRSDQARRFKEDAHGLTGSVGGAVVYRTDRPMIGGRLWAFAETPADRLAFAVSADGTRFSQFEPEAESRSAGDAATYGYWLPVLYRISHVPDGTRYLRVEFRSERVRLGRVELDYGEETTMDAAALRRSIEGELRDNILPFWRERSLDHTRGGFIAEMANDGTVRDDAPRGLILNARLLWTFSALHRRFGDARDLELARRAYRYLEDHFRDHEHGGYFWRVDPQGWPLDRDKKVYGQAFAIYALSEYHLATRDGVALAAARDLFALLERHAHDDRDGGYLEARANDWSPTGELRLGDGAPIAAKSMNTHLHLLEAYTTLYRAWPDPAVATRLRELIGIFTTHILGAGPGADHLHHFFDERWSVLSDSYTYGHDIEAVWLLCEAAEVLGDEELQRSVRQRATVMARAVLTEGLDAGGGLAYEGRGGAVVAAYHDWWCQAEAVVGFHQAFTLTGDAAFAEASRRALEYIARHFVDRVNGDWFWRVRADGTVDGALPKVSEWKCPYHNTRMCLEMLRRLDEPAGGR